MLSLIILFIVLFSHYYNLKSCLYQTEAVLLLFSVDMFDTSLTHSYDLFCDHVHVCIVPCVAGALRQVVALLTCLQEEGAFSPLNLPPSIMHNKPLRNSEPGRRPGTDRLQKSRFCRHCDENLFRVSLILAEYSFLDDFKHTVMVNRLQKITLSHWLTCNICFFPNIKPIFKFTRLLPRQNLRYKDICWSC